MPSLCPIPLSQSTAGVDAAKAGRLPASLTRRFDVYFVPEMRAPLGPGAHADRSQPLAGCRWGCRLDGAAVCVMNTLQRPLHTPLL